jgi:hypothetical protein
MAFWLEKAECPFCQSTAFSVSLFVNDMPRTNEPSELDERVDLSCSKCSNKVFEVVITKGGQVSAIGVSVCRKCKEDFRSESGSWREEDIPKTTHPVGTENCPRCNSLLQKHWWHGWNYTI